MFCQREQAVHIFGQADIVRGVGDSNWHILCKISVCVSFILCVHSCGPLECHVSDK